MFIDKPITYNYCTICGRQPKSEQEEPNRGPLRYWDPDGWRIGSLCRWCADEVLSARPHPDDYAYIDHRHDVCSGEPETDDDPTLAL